MSKILRFPGVEEPKQPARWKQVIGRGFSWLKDRVGRAALPEGMGKQLGLGAWSVARSALFMVMFWLRWLVVGLARILSMLLLVAFLFTWYSMPEAKEMLWTFGLGSFGAFVVMYGYDALLFALAPPDFMREV